MVSVSRVLVVGINPSSVKNVNLNTTIRRLPKWIESLDCGIVSFVNCIPDPGDYKFSDIDFDLLKKHADEYAKVVALGNFPSKALKKINVNHFTLPHPSGLNRKLNDKAYELDQLVKCKEYING